MPVLIERVINEISPEPNASSGSEQKDTRWQKRQEVNALQNQQNYLTKRLAADEFDD